jgi:hypothetical protein
MQRAVGGIGDARSQNLIRSISSQVFRVPVVQLGRAWTLIRGHRLGVFERPATRQIGGVSCGAECVAADGNFDTGDRCAASDHARSVWLCHGLDGQQAGPFGMPPRG